MLYAVGGQFLLGVFTLLYAVPVWLGVVHQVGAFLLLASVVYALHSFKK
jgi:cytochrome c oxidase assembly protein subunit 15